MTTTPTKATLQVLVNNGIRMREDHRSNRARRRVIKLLQAHKIINDVTSRLHAIFPAIKITAPNSPRLRVNDSATPPPAPEKAPAAPLCKLCRRVAPSVSAASSYSGPNSLPSTGCGTHHKRNAGKAIATAIPSGIGDFVDIKLRQPFTVKTVYGKERGQR